jgi:hypothetical protein
VAEQGSEPDDFSKSLTVWPWKLIYFRSPAGERYELYDLGRDPEERRDLAAQRPADLARLSARLWDLFEEQRPIGRDAASGAADLDAPARRQLRSLGYVAGSAAPKRHRLRPLPAPPPARAGPRAPRTNERRPKARSTPCGLRHRHRDGAFADLYRDAEGTNRRQRSICASLPVLVFAILRHDRMGRRGEGPAGVHQR